MVVVDLVESVIFSSPTQTVGKIVLRGRADSASLYRFFEDSMAAKGWSTVNAFQSSVSSLYFAKPGRFVAIVITQDSTVYINIGPERFLKPRCTSNKKEAPIGASFYFVFKRDWDE